MKRRSWLKGLFAAPLALVGASKHESLRLGQSSEAMTTSGQLMIPVQAHGSKVNMMNFEDAVINAVNRAQRRGRL